MAVYLGAGRVAALINRDAADGDLLAAAQNVFFQVTFGLIVGGVVLTALTAYLRWNNEIYGRQPVYRSWWMWLGPLIAIVPIVLRVLGIDWGGPTLSVVLMVLATGLMIGYVEELLFRGIAVKMMRDGGHREFMVALASSLLFGLAHSLNIFNGQALATVGVTVLYTFAFGVMMYLTMRSFGFIVAAMFVHGLTDPTTILATGGIDKVAENGDTGSLPALAGGVTFFILIPLAFVLLACVRGKAGEAKSGTGGPATSVTV
jgi:membrane protease YdiL (CAAX protease family)